MELSDVWDSVAAELSEPVLDLDAVTGDATDAMYEASRMASSVAELARLPDPFRSYVTGAVMPESFTTMLSSVSRSMMPDLSSLMPSVSKLLPDWSTLMPSVSALLADDYVSGIGGSYSKQLGGTLVKQLGGSFPKLGFSSIAEFVDGFSVPGYEVFVPVQSTAEFLSVNGIDGRSLGFGSLVADMVGAHADGILSGALSFDPMADVMRGLDARAAEFDAMMRPAPLESFAYVPASSVAPSIVERDVGAREATSVAVPAGEAEQAVPEGEMPGWVKVGVVFAGWSAVLGTAETVTYWVDRLG